MDSHVSTLSAWHQEEEDERRAQTLTITQEEPSVPVSVLSVREPLHLDSVH